MLKLPNLGEHSKLGLRLIRWKGTANKMGGYNWQKWGINIGSLSILGSIKVIIEKDKTIEECVSLQQPTRWLVRSCHRWQPQCRLVCLFHPRWSSCPLPRRWILAAATVSAQYEHVSFFLLYLRALRAYKPFRAFLLPLISWGFLDKIHLENIRWHRRHGGFSIKEPVSKAQQKMVLCGPGIASNPLLRWFVIRRAQVSHLRHRVRLLCEIACLFCGSHILRIDFINYTLIKVLQILPVRLCIAVLD